MRFATFASALAAISVARAQTSSDCDPTKKDCPNNPGLNQADYTVDFSKGLPKDWTATTGSIDATADGGRFRISKVGEGPTIQSNWYFFYGRIEAKFRAAPGQGIVSSIVLESSDLDEVDWEWIGSETTRAQSNYFGKGNTTTYDRGGFHDVANPATTWHTYAIDWTKDAITWFIDNNPVRTLKYADANGGHTFPQTPMNIRLGNWVGGAPGNAPGTIQWAGGPVDVSKGPFDMYVSTLTVKNYNPASEYKYSDRSGSTQSIQIINGGKVSTTPGNQEVAPGSGSNSGSNSGSGSGSSSGSTGGSNASVGADNHNKAGPTAIADPSSAFPTPTPYSSLATVSKVATTNVVVPTGKVTPTPSPSTTSILQSTGGAAELLPNLAMSLMSILGLFMTL